MGAIMAVFILLLGGCIPEDYSGPPGGRKVVVIGDSLTRQATDEIRGQFWLSDVFYYSVSGEDGKTSCDRVEDIRWTINHRKPDVLVVALGTNDAAQTMMGNQEWNHYEKCIDNITQSVIKNTPTVWVVPSFGNGVVREALSDAPPNVRIGGWDKVQKDSYYVRDGIHHNQKGQNAYAEFIFREVSSLS